MPSSNPLKRQKKVIKHVELAARLTKKLGLPQTETRKLLNAMSGVILEAFLDGDVVQIHGLGRIEMYLANLTNERTPTGQKITSGPALRFRLRATRYFKRTIRKGERYEFLRKFVKAKDIDPTTVEYADLDEAADLEDFVKRVTTRQVNPIKEPHARRLWKHYKRQDARDAAAKEEKAAQSKEKAAQSKEKAAQAKMVKAE